MSVSSLKSIFQAHNKLINCFTINTGKEHIQRIPKYSSPSPQRYWSPCNFWKNFGGISCVELINFNYPIRKNDISTIIRRFLEYQLHIRYQSSLLFLKNLTSTACKELISFRDPMHKNEFDNCYAGTAFNLPEKLVGSQYLYGGSYNISSLTYIRKTGEVLLMWN